MVGDVARTVDGRGLDDARTPRSRCCPEPPSRRATESMTVACIRPLPLRSSVARLADRPRASSAPLPDRDADNESALPARVRVPEPGSNATTPAAGPEKVIVPEPASMTSTSWSEVTAASKVPEPAREPARNVGS